MNELKIIIIGDGFVGKTSFLITATTNRFPEDYIPNVADTRSISAVVQGEEISLSLWDVMSQEDYDRLRALSYPETDLFIVSYSIDSPVSFDNVKSKWIPEIIFHCPKTPFILVAQKMDLRNNLETIQKLTKRKEKMVTYEKGRQLAVTINAQDFLECSSLERRNILPVIASAVRIALMYKNTNLRIIQKKPKKRIIYDEIHDPLDFVRPSVHYGQQISKLLTVNPTLKQVNENIFSADLLFVWPEKEEQEEKEILSGIQFGENIEVTKENQEKQLGGQEEKKNFNHLPKLCVLAHKSILSSRSIIFKKIFSEYEDSNELDQMLGIQKIRSQKEIQEIKKEKEITKEKKISLKRKKTGSITKYEVKRGKSTFPNFARLIKFLYGDPFKSESITFKKELTELKQLSLDFELPTLTDLCDLYLKTAFISQTNKRKTITQKKIQNLEEENLLQLEGCFSTGWRSQSRSEFELIIPPNQNDYKSKSKFIAVHKELLIVRSEYFFEKYMQLPRKEQEVGFQIDDTDFSLVADFVGFLYTKKVHFKSLEHAIQLLKMAQRFQCVDLSGYCQIYIGDTFLPRTKVTDVVECLNTLFKLDAPELADLCFEKIAKYYYGGIKKRQLGKSISKLPNKYKKLMKDYQSPHFSIFDSYQAFQSKMAKKFGFIKDPITQTILFY
ncbi:hypothetical protein M0812_06157 [Anaeramoeba flamelloides]|uniref:BTB domain-containing protein n=1 Tax=Anaeramoeba flamelloides TaxID=1746091 RepID=A0AAV8ADH8_9EUKA|nr:hypothetical protein M0812_06157 [Anaeramoeba flamelloides]